MKLYKIINKYIISNIIHCYIFFKLKKKFNSVIFNGWFHLFVNKKASLKIGKNTLINSSNIGYHINMYSRCKIYADRPNANIVIGNNCRLHGCCIHAYNEIHIGNNCLIAGNTQIIDGNGHLLNFDDPKNRINTYDEGKPIYIHDNVWIGANCIILGGTVIGKGSVISAGSVVKCTVPPMSLFGGNPARLLKTYSSNEN